MATGSELAQRPGKGISAINGLKKAQDQTGLDFLRVTLEFKNLSYEVLHRTGNLLCFWKRRVERKLILKDISGKAEPGDLIALMGASGAGKSTLLNVLSRRITGNDGDVFINGVSADKSPVITNSSCFIQQEDLFYGFITVGEHLRYQSRFRIPLNSAARKARVQDVIDTFSLNKSRNSRIGNIEQGASRGISGGEKKRLSVASELLTNPSLIFADEPTSGLDAFMAESVCDVLKTIAASGRTVISTIHQPSSDVFAMFNKLLLLSEGRAVYFGPRLAAIPYFLRLGHPCPPYTNPADFFVELCAIDWDNPAKKLEELNTWCEYWKDNSAAFLHEWETELKDKFASALEKSGVVVDDILGQHIAVSRAQTFSDEAFRIPHDGKGRPVRVKPLVVISTLLQRNITATARNPTVVRARLVQSIVTALLAGLVYFRLGDDASYSKAGACFFMMVNQGFMASYTCITAFMGEKRIVIREKDSGLYHLAIYYIAKIISDLMFQFYIPIIYSVICWFMIGLNDTFTRFLLGLTYIFLMALAAASIGYIIASFAPNLGVAVALGPIILLPCLLVAGFVIQKNSLPSFWIWLYYGSPFVYAFSGLMRATFLDVEFSLPPPKSEAEASVAFTSGNAVLASFGIKTDFNRWFIDAGALLIWIIFGRLFGLVLFLWSNKKRRK